MPSLESSTAECASENIAALRRSWAVISFIFNFRSKALKVCFLVFFQPGRNLFLGFLNWGGTSLICEETSSQLRGDFEYGLSFVRLCGLSVDIDVI